MKPWHAASAVLFTCRVICRVWAQRCVAEACSSSSDFHGGNPETGHALLQTRHSKIQTMLTGFVSRAAVSTTFSATVDPDSVGSTATLDEAGFKAVADLCCAADMDTFIRRVIESLNLKLCHEAGLLGLVPWYTCPQERSAEWARNQWKVPAMFVKWGSAGVTKTYAQLVKNLKDSTPPVPCSFVAVPGKCVPFAPECSAPPGTWGNPTAHRRRGCLKPIVKSPPQNTTTTTSATNIVKTTTPYVGEVGMATTTLWASTTPQATTSLAEKTTKPMPPNMPPTGDDLSSGGMTFTTSKPVLSPSQTTTTLLQLSTTPQTSLQNTTTLTTQCTLCVPLQAVPENLVPVLKLHNFYRCMHGVPYLLWNSLIANFSQATADRIAASGMFQHSAPSERMGVAGFASLGENLAEVQGLPHEAVRTWYDEIKATDGGLQNQFNANSKHYTQVIWKGSLEVGCGANGVVLVCNYGVPGNVAGQYQHNVLAPVKNETECTYVF